MNWYLFSFASVFILYEFPYFFTFPFKFPFYLFIYSFIIHYLFFLSLGQLFGYGLSISQWIDPLLWVIRRVIDRGTVMSINQ